MGSGHGRVLEGNRQVTGHLMPYVPLYHFLREILRMNHSFVYVSALLATVILRRGRCIPNAAMAHMGFTSFTVSVSAQN